MARRIDREYQRALDNYNRIKRELEKNTYIDAVSFLPYMPDLRLVDDNGKPIPLYGSYDRPFATRRDYERTLSYLERFNRAAESSDDSISTLASVATLAGVSANPITSVLLDAAGEPTLTSMFRHNESQLRVNALNRQTIAELKEMGINIVKAPVVTIDEDTGKTVNVVIGGRKATQYIAATPEQERRYLYAIQHDSTLRVRQPAVPDNSMVVKWGDIVDVESNGSSDMTNRQIARGLRPDEELDNKTSLYFANMRNIVDVTLPDSISDKFDAVFNQILKESPSKRHEIYRIMSGKQDDESIGKKIFDLDFIYLGHGDKASQRIAQLYDCLKKLILPLLSETVDMPDDYTAEDYEDIDAQLDGGLNGAGSIAARFRDLKERGMASTITMSDIRALRGGRG